jgi:hypothetical protein
VGCPVVFLLTRRKNVCLSKGNFAKTHPAAPFPYNMLMERDAVSVKAVGGRTKRCAVEGTKEKYESLA